MCGHDELQHMRSLDEIQTWLTQPMAGSAETLAAPYWRLLKKLAPTAKVVVVRRPVAEVVKSLLELETFGAGKFEPVALAQAMHSLDRK